jgi:hypothetical protein
LQIGVGDPIDAAGVDRAGEKQVVDLKATDLYFNVSQPSEWIPEYEAARRCTSCSMPSVELETDHCAPEKPRRPGRLGLPTVA